MCGSDEDAGVSVELIDVRAVPGVKACFTTRAGGVSTGSWSGLNLGSTTGDDPDAVRENRQRLCASVGVDAERATLGAQMHGATVRMIDSPSRQAFSPSTSSSTESSLLEFSSFPRRGYFTLNLTLQPGFCEAPITRIVSGETFKTYAVSSTLNPPKKRSSQHGSCAHR